MKPATINLDDIDGYEFEDVCQRIFTKVYNCRVDGTTYSNDMGKDLIIHSP